MREERNRKEKKRPRGFFSPLILRFFSLEQNNYHRVKCHSTNLLLLRLLANFQFICCSLCIPRCAVFTFSLCILFSSFLCVLFCPLSAPLLILKVICLPQLRSSHSSCDLTSEFVFYEFSLSLCTSN